MLGVLYPIIPREYALTRFIADLIRSRPKVDGIIYTSSRGHIQLFGTNIVLVREMPVALATAPRLYRWDWKMMGPPFGGTRSHLTASPV